MQYLLMVLSRMLINKRKDKNDMIYGIIGGLFVGIVATLVLVSFLDMMDHFGEWTKCAINYRRNNSYWIEYISFWITWI